MLLAVAGLVGFMVTLMIGMSKVSAASACPLS
jgi:hypothetical protein